ncbi:hypothetical protein [Solitalea canadensis]|uniref:Uncharacterized protein n=1 Tax=Solitalea canadensis (strain ATCC 29591 / DSM 3403 / JCM 21819 / LMG 8368 / NBRC 15130 / NCIMB 12057 / USAM 9D) TaxID=929556 RepID=H8KS69_SOLCM|nr:hypothetical protein [Solitalea canadensis]AFD07857.1 hypothetical protein Solca_2831 [Solitalea canadensis DSM 3403]
MSKQRTLKSTRNFRNDIIIANQDIGHQGLITINQPLENII